MEKRFTVKQLIAGVFCCIAAISATPVRAQDRTKLEKDLRTTYQDKLLSLRNPYFGSKLRFDSSGTLVGKEVAGPWSTCGLVHVDKLILAPDHLEIDGKRVILALRSEESSPSDVHVTSVVTRKSVRIIVDLSPVDVPQVNKVLSQVFQGGQLLERVAAYWKPKTADLKAFRASTPNAVIGELEGNRPVYFVNLGVMVPPKATHTPDPVYPEMARQDKLQGTTVLSIVVNEKGFPEILKITRGLGEGLDIQALAAVADWRFEPAKKNGQPVAVLINVEVTFRLLLTTSICRSFAFDSYIWRKQAVAQTITPSLPPTPPPAASLQSLSAGC